MPVCSLNSLGEQIEAVQSQRRQTHQDQLLPHVPQQQQQHSMTGVTKPLVNRENGSRIDPRGHHQQQRHQLMQKEVHVKQQFQVQQHSPRKRLHQQHLQQQQKQQKIQNNRQLQQEEHQQHAQLILSRPPKTLSKRCKLLPPLSPSPPPIAPWLSGGGAGASGAVGAALHAELGSDENEDRRGNGTTPSLVKVHSTSLSVEAGRCAGEGGGGGVQIARERARSTCVSQYPPTSPSSLEVDPGLLRGLDNGVVVSAGLLGGDRTDSEGSEQPGAMGLPEATPSDINDGIFSDSFYQKSFGSPSSSFVVSKHPMANVESDNFFSSFKEASSTEERFSWNDDVFSLPPLHNINSDLNDLPPLADNFDFMENFNEVFLIPEPGIASATALDISGLDGQLAASSGAGVEVTTSPRGSCRDPFNVVGGPPPTIGSDQLAMSSVATKSTNIYNMFESENDKTAGLMNSNTVLLNSQESFSQHNIETNSASTLELQGNHDSSFNIIPADFGPPVAGVLAAFQPEEPSDLKDGCDINWSLSTISSAPQLPTSSFLFCHPLPISQASISEPLCGVNSVNSHQSSAKCRGIANTSVVSSALGPVLSTLSGKDHISPDTFHLFSVNKNLPPRDTNEDDMVTGTISHLGPQSLVSSFCQLRTECIESTSLTDAATIARAGERQLVQQSSLLSSDVTDCVASCDNTTLTEAESCDSHMTCERSLNCIETDRSGNTKAMITELHIDNNLSLSNEDAQRLPLSIHHFNGDFISDLVQEKAQKDNPTSASSLMCPKTEMRDGDFHPQSGSGLGQPRHFSPRNEKDEKAQLQNNIPISWSDRNDVPYSPFSAAMSQSPQTEKKSHSSLDRGEPNGVVVPYLPLQSTRDTQSWYPGLTEPAGGATDLGSVHWQSFNADSSGVCSDNQLNTQIGIVNSFDQLILSDDTISPPLTPPISLSQCTSFVSSQQQTQSRVFHACGQKRHQDHLFPSRDCSNSFGHESVQPTRVSEQPLHKHLFMLDGQQNLQQSTSSQPNLPCKQNCQKSSLTTPCSGGSLNTQARASPPATQEVVPQQVQQMSPQLQKQPVSLLQSVASQMPAQQLLQDHYEAISPHATECEQDSLSSCASDYCSQKSPEQMVSSSPPHSPPTLTHYPATVASLLPLALIPQNFKLSEDNLIAEGLTELKFEPKQFEKKTPSFFNDIKGAV